MPSYKDKLIAEYGEVEGMRILSEHMKQLRTKVKNPGFASMDKDKLKEISQKGVEGRKRGQKT